MPKPRGTSGSDQRSWPRLLHRRSSTLNPRGAPIRARNFRNHRISNATSRNWLSRPDKTVRLRRVAQILDVSQREAASSRVEHLEMVRQRRTAQHPTGIATRQEVVVSQGSLMRLVRGRWVVVVSRSFRVVQAAGWGLVVAPVVGLVLGCWVVGRRCRLFSRGLVPGVLGRGWPVLGVPGFRACRRRLLVG